MTKPKAKTKPTQTQSCGNCFFSRVFKTGEGGVLLCHRNPPLVMVIDGKINGHIPPVSPDFWGCGEYKYSAEPKVIPVTSPPPG